jgi:hypothetical protein
VTRRWPVPAVLLVGWLAYGLFWAALPLRAPRAEPWRAVVVNLWLFAPALVASLVVSLLARRFRVRPGHVAGGIALHGALAVAFALAQAVSYWELGFFRPPMPVLGPVTLRYVLRDVFVYLLVASIVHARDFADAWRAQRVKAAATSAALARSALDAACWRMQPDVVLPALERIEEHLQVDPDRAEEALARLGDLLRLLLHAPESDRATLDHEVAVLGAAADLVGRETRLQVLVEGDAGAASVPRLLVLALLHETLRAPGASVCLRARCTAGRLDLHVDSVPPPAPEQVAAARARMEAAFPGHQLLLGHAA